MEIAVVKFEKPDSLDIDDDCSERELNFNIKNEYETSDTEIKDEILSGFDSDYSDLKPSLNSCNQVSTVKLDMNNKGDGEINHGDLDLLNTKNDYNVQDWNFKIKKQRPVPVSLNLPLPFEDYAREIKVKKPRGSDSILSNGETGLNCNTQEAAVKLEMENIEKEIINNGEGFIDLFIKQEDFDNSDSCYNDDVHIMVATDEFQSESTCKRINSPTKEYDWKLRVRFKCKICKKWFSSEVSLDNHIASHANGGQYKCNVCMKRFLTKVHLKTHAKLQSCKQRFICKTCGQVCRTKKTLKNHQRSHILKKPYACAICGKGFRTVKFSKLHALSHQDEDKRRGTNSVTKCFTCKFCGKDGMTRLGLKYHEYIHTAINPFKCETCGLELPTKNSLKIHSESHEVIAPYNGEISGKVFTAEQNIKGHTKTHMVQRSHKLKKSYLGIRVIDGRSSTIEYKIRTNPGETAYSCEICYSKFVFLNVFKAHIQSHMKSDVNVKFVGE